VPDKNKKNKILQAVADADYKNIDALIATEEDARELFLNIKSKAAAEAWQQQNRPAAQMILKPLQRTLKVLFSDIRYAPVRAQALRKSPDNAKGCTSFKCKLGGFYFLDKATVCFQPATAYTGITIYRLTHKRTKVKPAHNHTYELSRGLYDFILPDQTITLKIK